MKVIIEREHIGNAVIPDKNGNSLGQRVIGISAVKRKGEWCDVTDMDGKVHRSIHKNSINIFKKK